MEDVRLLIVAVIFIGVALTSHLLQRWSISTPAAVVAIGFLIGVSPLKEFDPNLASSVIRTVAEVTLALMLFHDASRIGLSNLRGRERLPGRLLLIGLPIMIVLGTVVAHLMIPSLGWIGAALAATMLAPTDAALGEQVVTDERLPGWLRQGINVESGLNDGLSVPVFLVLIELATTTQSWTPGVLGSELARLIGIGVLAGAVFGGVGSLLVRGAAKRDLMLASWSQYAVLGIALASYVSAAVLGGSGFIGAFVGGLFFGGAAREQGEEAMRLIGGVGTVMDTVAFLLLGVVMVPSLLGLLSWQIVLYAVLSLVVIREVSVGIAMLGTKAAPQTTAFIGWFGPRGLATVVFTMMLLDSTVAHKDVIATIAVTGVVLSVYAHGFTAPWLSGVYATWYESFSSRADGQPELAQVSQPPLRRVGWGGRRH